MVDLKSYPVFIPVCGGVFNRFRPINERRIVMITGSLGALGVGMVAIGTGVGIGLIGSSAMTAMSRQPEIAAKIQVSMLISAALIEGVALFCAVICLIGAK